MPSKKSGASQSAKQKQSLKKLKELGLYNADLRKKPTRAALNALKKYDAVLSGKAMVVQPRDPRRFKGIYDVKGKNVIVPKRKGEKITVDKTGEIVSKRKVGKRTITSRGITTKRGAKIEKPAPEKRVQYAIPFNASGGGVNWMRFPSFDELQKFMAGYDYKDWRDYVVVEEIDNEFDDDELSERLETKRKGRRIRGGLPRAVKRKTTKKKSGKRK